MTKRLPFATTTAILAFVAGGATAQELPEPRIGRRPVLAPAVVLPPPAKKPAPAAPVGTLLAPVDTAVVALPGAATDSAAGFVGPLLPGAASPYPGLPTAVAATPAPDTAAAIRTQVIEERLRALYREIPLVYNPYVRGYIDYFTVRNPKYTRRMLERQTLYFPLFERKLAQYGMPTELKYLSVVESALNTKVASHAKAVGLWQFIPEAAHDYRLVINSWKDERMDPEKATDAACRYLRNLNRAFAGDWELALAAYNCGPGNVRRAIRKAGGKTSFWAIFPYLPKETRGYVPSFTAVVYAMNHAAEYNIIPENQLLPVTSDTVHVSGPFDLARLADTLGLDVAALHDLNPELRRPLLPVAATSYALRIPADKRLAVDALTRADLLAACRPTSAAVVALAQDSVRAATKTALKASRYVVRRGESLQRVAAKNGCSVAQLRTWNRLKHAAVVQPGQKLVVWHAVKPTAPTLKPAPAAATDNPVVATALPAPAAAPVTVATTTVATPTGGTPAATIRPANSAGGGAVAGVAPIKSSGPFSAVAQLSGAQLDSARATGYTVQRGDNLFQIARMFNVGVRQLTEWNGLASAQVQLGQTLVVRAAAAELPALASAPNVKPAAGKGVAQTAAPVVAEAPPVVPADGELAGTEFVAPPQVGRPTRLSAATRQRARQVHLVQPGDTLWDISRKRNVSVEQIRKLNRLKSDALRPGQRIILS